MSHELTIPLQTNELLRPPPHVSLSQAPLQFFARTILDLQFASVLKNMKSYLPGLTGKILDVGCGNGPFQHLLNLDKAEYIGVDVANSEHFDYQNPKALLYDGKKLPFPDKSIDHVICSEVLEHVSAPEELISEIHRVMKEQGTALFTIPWSARFHYIPHDYGRYTPTKLNLLFKGFSYVQVTPRGTDLAVIASKIMTVFFRNLIPKKSIVRSVFAICLSPMMIPVVLFGQFALWTRLGASEDPLGYTIKVVR